MTPRRRGFTLIEILLVIILIGVMSGWAISNFRNVNYRMDSNIRLMQNILIGAQQTAISRNIPVQVMFDASAGGMRVRVLLDADDDGQVSVNEVVSYRPLVDGAQFLSPPATIDNAALGYITGPGLVTGRPVLMQAVRVAPNGTLGGDFTVYIGTTSARPTDFRALSVVGATARTSFWSYQSGSWRRRNY